MSSYQRWSHLNGGEGTLGSKGSLGSIVRSKGSPHGILTKVRIHVPPAYCVVWGWGWPSEEGMVVLPYLSCSDGVSCSTSSMNEMNIRVTHHLVPHLGLNVYIYQYLYVCPHDLQSLLHPLCIIVHKHVCPYDLCTLILFTSLPTENYPLLVVVGFSFCLNPYIFL